LLLLDIVAKLNNFYPDMWWLWTDNDYKYLQYTPNKGVSDPGSLSIFWLSGLHKTWGSSEKMNIFFYFRGASSSVVLCMVTRHKSQKKLKFSNHAKAPISKIMEYTAHFDWVWKSKFHWIVCTDQNYKVWHHNSVLPRRVWMLSGKIMSQVKNVPDIAICLWLQTF